MALGKYDEEIRERYEMATQEKRWEAAVPAEAPVKLLAFTEPRLRVATKTSQAMDFRRLVEENLCRGKVTSIGGRVSIGICVGFCQRDDRQRFITKKQACTHRCEQTNCPHFLRKYSVEEAYPLCAN